MTNKKYISLNSVRKHALIKLMDIDLFISCCLMRERYDSIGATREQWLELASKFQQAKGPRVSYMAEYCVRKAGSNGETQN